MGSANTKLVFSTEDYRRIAADGIIIPVFEEKTGKDGKKKPALTRELTALCDAMQGAIGNTAQEEQFDGGKGKTLVLRKSPGDTIRANRVIVMGLGDPAKLTVDDVEKYTLRALSSLTRLERCETIAIAVPTGRHVASSQAIVAIADAVYQSTYRSLESKRKGPEIKTVSLLLKKAATAEEKHALTLGHVMAKARSFAKDLVNMPSNIKTAEKIAEAAKTIGKLKHISAKVVTDGKWIEKTMPCFYEVARGSVATDPPRWIALTYKPTGPVKKKIALIGKSVVFDTGGYQVKTGNFMNTMKGDMTGGALVLGTMQALSELSPSGIQVNAYLAATPNKIDSHAMLPDAIVDTTCGKKVEIRHTDAEGRLTLIDAVAMAAKDEPDEILTIATLTGSASQAVGLSIALMGNDKALEDKVNAAAEYHGEPVQQLKVVEDDYDNIKSKLDGADIINTSQRKNRGAQTAAAFVMSGAPDGIPMAHMDIAGADMSADEKATGIGAKTLIQYVLSQAGKSSSRKASKPKALKPARRKR